LKKEQASMNAILSGSKSITIPADPSTVLSAITDLGDLPEWNRRIRRVVDRPAVLTPGAEWVVELRAFGRTWHSRSRLVELDPQVGRFVYESATDDGNPSRARWAWDVRPDPAGSRLTVSWDLQPVTFWRRVLLGRIRAAQLSRSEVPASLAALASWVGTASSTPTA
jgi:uncharacterized protein YndB with AHSA1/START domain